jgi:hypothetical protein
MKVSKTLVLSKSFKLEKFLTNPEAKAIKFRCEIDVFGKQTLGFLNVKDCKTFNDLIQSSKKK